MTREIADSSWAQDPDNGNGDESGRRRERLDKLLSKARSLARSPGVYLMKDAAGLTLYVGKAARLCERVSSYFVASADLGPRKQPMLDIVADFEVLECETEWEALLAENRLIKDIKPRFNSRLLDDKTFPYLVVTMGDDFPRVAITRAPASEEFAGGGGVGVGGGEGGPRVFGPFVRPSALRRALPVLQKAFRFRTCELEIHAGNEKNRFFRPCILHALGMCTAPCADRIGKDEYRADIGRLVRFLESKRSVMLREMREEMDAASARQDYERAAMVRDRIRAIEQLDERSRMRMGWQPESEAAAIDPRKGLRKLRAHLGLEGDVRCIEGIDIAHLSGESTVGAKVCFVDGRPLKEHYRRYLIRTAGNDDFKAIGEVVSRRYREAGAGQELYPDVILVDGGLGQLRAAMAAFLRLDVKPPMVISLAKKEEVLFVQGRGDGLRLPRRDEGLRLCQAVRDEAHRFAQHYHHLLRKKKTLGED